MIELEQRMPPGIKFLPNAITVLALCAGLSAIAYASRGDFMLAAWLVAAATVLDSLDGPAARLLKATSRIGAELDSFSDCIAFGVAPAMMMYFWGLNTFRFGWAVCLLYAVCTTLRLARFNSLLDDETPRPWAKGFFTGIPSPAGALLAIQPLVLSIRFPGGPWQNPWSASIWLAIVGALMVSRLPTIALKSVILPRKVILPALLLLVVAVAFFFWEPIIVTAVGLLVYLAHLPYAFWRYQHVRTRPELWLDNRRAQAKSLSARRMRPRVPRLRPTAGGRPQLPRVPQVPRVPRIVRTDRPTSTVRRPSERNRITRDDWHG